MPAGIWKGSISFGLLNIPVSLQSAKRSKPLKFSMLDETDFSGIKYKKVNETSGKEVPYKSIVKGYKDESGGYVILTKDDFKAANPKATQTIDIEDFVEIGQIDPIYFDQPYYIVPQKKAEKGYALLRDALKKSEKVAIGKIVMRTKQHLAAILPRDKYLILQLVRFAHEVIETNDADYLDGHDVATPYSSRELKMAEELVSGMTADWTPTKYKDSFRDDLMKLIEKKAKSGGKKIKPNSDYDASTGNEKIIDLLPLLRKSLEASRDRTATKKQKALPARKKERRG